MNNIQKWNQVQEELKEGTSAQVSVPSVSLNISAPEDRLAHMSIARQVPVPQPHTTAVSNGPSKSGTPEPVEVDFEFSDTVAMTCLLCARQFKTMDQLKRHNKESDLHKARYFIHLCIFPEIGLMRRSSCSLAVLLHVAVPTA